MFKIIGIKKRDTSGNELTEQLLGTAQGFSCQNNTELTTLSLGHPKDFSTREKKPLIQWGSLPRDIAHYVSSYLDLKSLVSLAHINKTADFLLDINGERLNKVQKILTVSYSRKYPRYAYDDGEWGRDDCLSDIALGYRMEWRLVWLLLDKKHEVSFKTRLDFFNYYHKTLSQPANQIGYSKGIIWFMVLIILLPTTMVTVKHLLPRSWLDNDGFVLIMVFTILALSAIVSFYSVRLCCQFHEGVAQRRFMNAVKTVEFPDSYQPLLRQLLNDTRLHWDSEETLQQLYDQMEPGESLPRGVTMV